MSLPPKAVSNPAAAAAAGTGPGTGPSPSSQLRATLTTVPLPPGTPVAQQPLPVPQTQYPSLKASGSFTNMCFFLPQNLVSSAAFLAWTVFLNILGIRFDAHIMPETAVQAGGSLGFDSARVCCTVYNTKCLVWL